MDHLTARKTDTSLKITFETRSISDPLTVESVLTELVKTVQTAGQFRVNLDFSNVQLVSTGMLGALLRFRSHAQYHGFAFVLSGLNGKLQEVFTQSGVEGLFEIEPSAVATASPKQAVAVAAEKRRSLFCLA